MIIWIGKWLERLRFVVLFVILAFLLYHFLLLLSNWIEPLNKSKVPSSSAVKVFGNAQEQEWTVSDRLKLFYWYGE